jgi:hypothetical protein
MAYPIEPLITKQVDIAGEAHYTVRWSPLTEVDKYTIIKSVPAVAGLFELYYKDDRGKLIRFYMARVWIGGLRSTLRRLTDPELNEDEKWRDILENKTCYFRYAQCNSYKDLTDVLYFFSETFFPHEKKTYNSERYTGIFVDEVSPDKIVDI